MNSASPQTPASKQLRDTTKQLCAADTIHDFWSDLNNNSIFKEYIDVTMSEHLTGFNKANVEDDVFKKILHIDESTIPDIANIEKDKPFSIIVDNVSDPTFKHLLGAISATANDRNIHYITDTTILSKKTICDIKITKKDVMTGAFVISEATYYDSGTDKEKDGICTIESNINAKLTKSKGNLFGLNAISVGKSVNNETYFSYSYDNQPETTIKIKDFIKHQNEAQNDPNNKNRNKNFFIKTINLLPTTSNTSSKKTKKGGAGTKRKATDSASKLETVFSILNNVYELDVRDFDFSSKSSIFKFMSILFDFKRAGDQLQIMSAKKNKNVFISNDKISIAYATLSGIPCIKTSAFGAKNGTDHRKRKLIFYNFDKDKIVREVLNNKDYYKDAVLYNISILEKFIPDCERLQLRVKDLLFTKHNNATFKKFKSPYTVAKINQLYIQVQENLKKSMEKSEAILNISTNLAGDMQSAHMGRKVASKATSSDLNEESKKRVFFHNYVLQYNIIVCMLLKYLLSVDLNNNIEDLKAQVQSKQDINENDLKTFIESDFRIQIAHFLKLSDITLDFFIDTIKYYIEDHNADILYTNIDESFDKDDFNKIIAAVTNVPKKYKDQKIDIPVISKYIKLINSTNWSSSPNKTTLLFFNPIFKQIECKSAILPKQEIQKFHNKLVEEIYEYNGTLKNLSTYSAIFDMKPVQIMKGGVPHSRKSKPRNTKIIENITMFLSQKQYTYYELFMEDFKEMKRQEDNSLANQFYEIMVFYLIRQFRVFDRYGNISEKYEAPSVVYSKSPSLQPIYEENNHKQNYEAYKQHFMDNNLKSSNLMKSNLKSSNLMKSNLKSSNLMKSNLMKSNLKSSNLMKSNLKSSNLMKSNLMKSNLKSSNLMKSNLMKSNLMKSNTDVQVS
jgi:hypothetical protein